jgi:amino acid transporter
MSEASPAVPATELKPTPAVPAAELKPNAIGLWSSVGVGVAATTPAVSVALVFGLLAAGVGVHMPGALLLGFVPILLISLAYRRLNEVDPDCGTVFAWATKAFGPYVGWFGGFVVIAALAVIVTNFAQLLGLYSFELVGWDEAVGSTAAVTALGTAWFIGLTLIAYRGIELSKKVQLPFLLLELLIFSAFAIVALVKAATDDPAGSITPALDWLSPTGAGVEGGALAGAFAAAVLMFWGWDTSVMVNEESEDRTRNPGRAAVIATVVLLGFYILMAIGLLAYAGPDRLADSEIDVISLLAPEVFGGTADRLLIFAGLTSAIAGCLFLPIGGARTMLSMAREGALPKAFAAIHPRFRTPSTATIVFAAVSLVYFIVMTLISESILLDSLAALSLLVALYYALTGFSCAVYFRRRWSNGWRDALMLGVSPLLGASALTYVLIRTAIDQSDPINSAGGTAWLGVGAPLAIAVVIVLLGIIGAVVSRMVSPEFFTRKTEAAD